MRRMKSREPMSTTSSAVVEAEGVHGVVAAVVGHQQIVKDRIQRASGASHGCGRVCDDPIRVPVVDLEAVEGQRALGEDVLVPDQDRVLAAEDLSAVIAAQGGVRLRQTAGEQQEEPGIGQQTGDGNSAQEDERARPGDILLQTQADQQRDRHAERGGNGRKDPLYPFGEIRCLQLFHKAIRVGRRPDKAAAALEALRYLADAGGERLSPQDLDGGGKAQAAVVLSPEEEHGQRAEDRGKGGTQRLCRAEAVQRSEERAQHQQQGGVQPVGLPQPAEERLPADQEGHAQKPQLEIHRGAAGEDLRQEGPVPGQIQRKEQTDKGEQTGQDQPGPHFVQRPGVQTVGLLGMEHRLLLLGSGRGLLSGRSLWRGGLGRVLCRGLLPHVGGGNGIRRRLGLTGRPGCARRLLPGGLLPDGLLPGRFRAGLPRRGCLCGGTCRDTCRGTCYGCGFPY